MAKGVGLAQLAGLAFVVLVSMVVLRHGLELLESTEIRGFPGPRWQHPGRTVESKELYNAAFARVESHTIRTEDGDLIPGWIWVDFRHRVDVVVEDDQGTFHFFEQINYGLDRVSLAPVSRHLGAANEDPLRAAQEELLLEMGREAPEWIQLGSFVGDANRGAGRVTCFLARHATVVKEPSHHLHNELEEKAPVQLSREELEEAVLTGRFAEIKWAAAVSLALSQLRRDTGADA